MFVLPDLPHFSDNHLGGTYVKVGSETNWTIGSGAQLWDPANPIEPLREFGGISCARGSSAVMYASDKILKFGGPGGGSEGIASRVSEVLDLSTPCPMWRPAGPTGMPRHFSSGVLLPDGTVLALGGSASNVNLGDDGNDPDYAVFTAELFQPDDDPEAALPGSWCRLADVPGAQSDEVVYRGYHSQSFLLPDGRVYHGSGGLTSDPAVDHYDYHIYAPPYLFWGPRPDFSLDPLTIANGIAWMEAGDEDPVVLALPEDPVEITRVTMVKLSASTHQFDQEQRFVELEILEEDEDDEVHVAPPPSTCYATPGYYMLFAISSAGVPSIGKYVAVHGSCPEAAEPAVVPEPLLPAPRAVNDLAASGAIGLRASCGGEGSTLALSDFGQSLLDLCAATGACPADGTIDVEVRFLSTTGSASADPDDLLSSAVVTIADGEPSFFTDGIVLNVAGTEFNSNVSLGPGDHIVEVCGTLSLLSACIEQPLRIDPELAHDSEYRAGSIERREVILNRHPIQGLTVDLDLGDDDVAEVGLPDDFVFPFYGEEVDTLWVGANGAVRIDEGTVPASNTGLPETGKPQIAVYWDDLDPSESGRVWTHYDGDRFIVAWEGVAVAAGGRVSAQLHLHRSGRIEMHYPHMASGPSAFGLGATIGIQDGTEALALSVSDDELLAANDAIAIDAASCIASQLRLPDATPCIDRVATSPKDIGICSGAVDVLLTAPRVSTMCESHKEANVSGSVWLGPDRQAAARDGSVQMYVGDYVARWSMQEPAHGPAGVEYHDVGVQASEVLRVRLTDDPEVCCREDQAVHTLTASGDIAAYADNEPVCVVAQGGSDDVDGDDYDDTLLGQGGDDDLDGANGNDIVFGGVGDDTLSGGAGDDVILGAEDDDALAGNAGDDELWGGDGADSLVGGADSDTLLPGPGQDSVDGGSGNDHVVILHRCELVSGETLDGGADTDTLWLPSEFSVTDLPNFGVTVSNFEVVETIEGGAWGTAECLL